MGSLARQHLQNGENMSFWKKCPLLAAVIVSGLVIEGAGVANGVKSAHRGRRPNPGNIIRAYLVENGGGGVAPHIGDAVRNQHQVLAAVVNGGVGGQHSGARPYAGIDVGAALQLVFKDGFNLGIAIGVQAGQRQDEALVVSGFVKFDYADLDAVFAGPRH